MKETAAFVVALHQALPAVLTLRGCGALLLVAASAEPLAFSTLAKLAKMSKPSLSRAVSVMAELGFVAKLCDPDDGKRLVVKILPPGLAFAERILASHRRLMALSNNPPPHIH